MTNSIYSNVRSSNKSKSSEQIAEQIDAWLEDETFCHYFAIQKSGSEIHPYGFLDRPFYCIEQANRKLNDLKSSEPNESFYIVYGGLATSSLNFDDESVPMFERIWLNKHEYRLTKLRFSKLNHDQLVQLVPEFDEVMAWEKKHNTKNVCHYYQVYSTHNEHGDVPTSSQQFIKFVDALAAKIIFNKSLPHRDFQIGCFLMLTENVLSLDGRTADHFQEFIDDHKDRLASLVNGL